MSSSSGSLPKKIGKLVFKGDKDKKASPRPKASTALATSSVPKAATVEEEDDEIKIVTGTGRISTSSTTVHGVDTKFMRELSPGDAILVTHPTSLVEETKIVKMVLSDVSIAISSAFSTDLITTTPFSYIKAATAKDSREASEASLAKEKEKLIQLERQSLGTYGQGGEGKFVYRVKTTGSFGGYKILTESAEGKSREDLLTMRAKKKSDRFCN